MEATAVAAGWILVVILALCAAFLAMACTAWLVGKIVDNIVEMDFWCNMIAYLDKRSKGEEEKE